MDATLKFESRQFRAGFHDGFYASGICSSLFWHHGSYDFDLGLDLNTLDVGWIVEFGRSAASKRRDILKIDGWREDNEAQLRRLDRFSDSAASLVIYGEGQAEICLSWQAGLDAVILAAASAKAPIHFRGSFGLASTPAAEWPSPEAFRAGEPTFSVNATSLWFAVSTETVGRTES